MKTSHILFTIVLIVGCTGTPKNNSDKKDELLNSFSREEYQDVQQILSFFDAQISKRYGNASHEEGLKQFLTDFIDCLSVARDNKESCSFVSFADQKELYAQLSKGFFSEIWHMGAIINENDTMLKLMMQETGSYSNFLKSFATENDMVAEYYLNFTSSGYQNQSINKIISNPEILLRDRRMIFLVVVHYLTFNDHLNREERYEDDFLGIRKQPDWKVIDSI